MIVIQIYRLSVVFFLSSIAARAEGPRHLGCNFNVNVAHSKEIAERPMTPEMLHRFVQMGNGYGGLRCPRFFRAAAGAKFYRLWDGRKDTAEERGYSFTLTRFAPHDRDYRRKFGVCEKWNDLSKEFICEIKPGATAIIAIGPGEQVSENTCGRKREFYREVPDLQVMFVTDPKTVCK
jgi:hypothetical protein